MKKIIYLILCFSMLFNCIAGADVVFTRPDDILLWVDGKWVKSKFITGEYTVKDRYGNVTDYGTYEDGTVKQWMIQPWKGQYGMVLYGAELGVYTKPETRVTPHYDCASDEDLLGMTMTVYKDEKEAFTMPYDMYWWITGFKPGALDNYTDMSKPHSQLTLTFTVDLKSEEMAKLFADGLEEKGFEKVGFIDTVNFRKVDTYMISGNRVVFLWRNIVDSDKGTNM